MNTVSSFSGYSTRASSSRGLSGLASGMDTEEMVEKMLSGTQAKIDKQKGIKLQTQWKQDIYRDLISKINNFQLKFFSFTSSTNIMSKEFFNTMTAVSGSDAIKVSGTSSASVGNTEIEVKQLASRTTLKSAGNVSGDLIVNIDSSQLTNRTVTFTIGEEGAAKQLAVDLTGATSAEDIAAKINEAAGNANLGENGLAFSAKIFEGRLILDSNTAFSVKGDESSALSLAMLGLNAESKASGAGSGFSLISTANAEAKASVNITLDGVTKAIEINDSSDVKTQLEDGIKKAFGTSAITLTENGNEITIGTSQGRQITITGNDVGMKLLGVANGQSNKISMGLKLSELNTKPELSGVDEYKFTINGTEFKFDKDATLSKVINDINSSQAGVKLTYSALEDKFTMEAADSGAGFDINFNDDSGNLMKALFGETPNKTEGKNAIVTVNGLETERSSNSFTVNGLNIEITKETGPVTIQTKRDTQKIFDGIKSFVDDYNKLISELNSLVSEKAEYKKYPPLTQQQKKEMTDKEIELWEEKAKVGLIRGDSNVSQFLSSMRYSLYTKPEGAKYALYDIGIETSGEWKDNGKLIIDEAKLKKLLDQDPQEVANLFNNSVDGIAKKLDSAIKEAASTSSASPGSLVRVAGVVGRVTEKQNTLTKMMDDIEERIKNLSRTFEKEKTRYWNQFNAMEKVIANLSSQSSWLGQYMM